MFFLYNVTTITITDMVKMVQHTYGLSLFVPTVEAGDMIDAAADVET